MEENEKQEPKNICSKCNAEVPANLSFCTSCGNKMTNADDEKVEPAPPIENNEATEQKMPVESNEVKENNETFFKKNKYMIIGLAVVLVLIAIVMISKKPDSTVAEVPATESPETSATTEKVEEPTEVPVKEEEPVEEEPTKSPVKEELFLTDYTVEEFYVLANTLLEDSTLSLSEPEEVDGKFICKIDDYNSVILSVNPDTNSLNGLMLFTDLKGSSEDTSRSENFYLLMYVFTFMSNTYMSDEVDIYEKSLDLLKKSSNSVGEYQQYIYEDFVYSMKANLDSTLTYAIQSLN